MCLMILFTEGVQITVIQNQDYYKQFYFIQLPKKMSREFDVQALRSKAIMDSSSIAEKSRFGLFSCPLTTAVGDDGAYKTKLHPKDQSGKPQTSPRGIFTNPTKTGQLKKNYFGDINTLAALKDQYIDPDRKLLQIQNQTFQQGFTKDQNFKPASLAKTLHKAAYEYVQEKNPELNPKRNRQQDGRVKAKPRNFYTNLQTTVIRSYFKPIPHMTDPYERAHQLQLENLKKQKSMEAEAAFKSNSFHVKLFNKNKNVFGEDVELKPKTARELELNIYKHETKWKDTNEGKHGIKGFFTPVTYVEDPPKEKQRISSDKDKDAFKTKSSISNIVQLEAFVQSQFQSKKMKQLIRQKGLFKNMLLE